MTYCEHCGQPLAPGTAECPVCHTTNFQDCTAQQNTQSQSATYGQQAYSQPQGDPYGQQATANPKATPMANRRTASRRATLTASKITTTVKRTMVSRHITPATTTGATLTSPPTVCR